MTARRDSYTGAQYETPGGEGEEIEDAGIVPAAYDVTDAENAAILKEVKFDWRAEVRALDKIAELLAPFGDGQRARMLKWIVDWAYPAYSLEKL